MTALGAVRALIIGCLGGILPMAYAAEQFDIVYARFSAGDDPRIQFPLAVLDLAMKKMNTGYTVKPSTFVMERGRAVIEVETHREVNLVWTSMSADVEKRLRPIRIPLYRGLIGHRLFLINKNRQGEFSRVSNLEDLKKFKAGQGLGWIDVKIMQDAGLLVTTSTYDTLFKMTSDNRVDYFPRGANEAYAELRAHQHSEPQLDVEKHLALYYRSDLLFYTSKQDEALASTLEKGLLAAYADGSYLKLFNDSPYVQQALKEAELDKRLTIEIPNPMLSEEDRAIPDRFWLQRRSALAYGRR